MTSRSLLITFVLAASVAASAQESKQSVSLGELDKNGDGAISREEAQATSALRSRFDQIDVDKNGLLSRAELRSGVGANQALAWFADADTNIDGKLSREELQDARPALVAALPSIDKDGDGQLSRDEISAHSKAQDAAKAVSKE